MRFSTIFTVLAAGATAFAAAVPGIAMKRSVTDIQNAFNTFSSAADTIIPKLDDCMDDTCSKNIVTELVQAISACNSTIGGLTGGPATPALTSLVANVVTVSNGKFPGSHFTDASLQKIGVGLDGHKTKCGSKCPGLPDIYAQVDSPLSLCLQKVSGPVPDLLPPVTTQ